MKSLFSFLSAILLMITLQPIFVSAEEEKTIVATDRSIYDVLIDRYNNGTNANDKDVDKNNPMSYHGGDFIGLVERIQHIAEMNFTTLSIGNVFESSNYLGDETSSYERLNAHFGTEDELKEIIKQARNNGMDVIVDAPINQLSKNHPLVQKYADVFDGKEWTTPSQELISDMANQLTDFVEKYELGGIRLTQIEGWSTDHLNELLGKMRTEQPELFIISKTPSSADFSLKVNPESMSVLRTMFKEFNGEAGDFSNLTAHDELIAVDTLESSRFTYDMVELRMFPPTRWKDTLTVLFTMPGVPILTYGSEIAMNGQTIEESHQMMNFKTEMELKDLIGILNKLRNQSETIRTGSYKLLSQENNYLVYTIEDQQENWIVAINNSDNTQSYAIDSSAYEGDKKLRGVVNSDLVKRSKDDKYHLVQDREQTEIYYVEEDTGFNTTYLIASIMIYAAFLLFLFVIIKNSKKNRQAAK